MIATFAAGLAVYIALALIAAQIMGIGEMDE